MLCLVIAIRSSLVQAEQNKIGLRWVGNDLPGPFSIDDTNCSLIQPTRQHAWNAQNRSHNRTGDWQPVSHKRVFKKVDVPAEITEYRQYVRYQNQWCQGRPVHIRTGTGNNSLCLGQWNIRQVWQLQSTISGHRNDVIGRAGWRPGSTCPPGNREAP